MKTVPHFRVGDEVRVMTGTDCGRRGWVKSMSDQYVAGQGQLVKVHLNGEDDHADDDHGPWYPTYCGASLKKLEQ
jgi:ribosomal protein L24